MIGNLILKERLIKIFDYIIEYGILAIVFFIPLIFDFTGLSYNIVDLYKIVFFRIIISLIFLAYLAKVFITGRLSYRGSGKIFLFVFFLLSSFFISSWFSLNPSQSFFGNFLRQQGFYNYFNYLLFFILLILNIRDFKQIKRIVAAVILSASLTAVYGLIQYFNLDPVHWSEKAVDLGRIYSTLGQPNFFGHYLILVLPFSLYALIFMAKGILPRFFVILAILMQLFCLIFTYSRAAWLGFFGATAFLLLIWLVFGPRKKLVISFVGCLLIGLIIIIGLNAIKPIEQSHSSGIGVINRLKSLTDPKSGSNKMRLYYLESAVKEIKGESFGRLIFGYGPETLSSIFIKHYRQDWGVYEAINGYPDRAHNWLFDQILTLGFLGLMANLAFYFYLIYKAIIFLRARNKLGSEDWLIIFLSASLVGYFINNLFSFSLFTNYVYLFLILALAWLIINYEEKNREIEIKLTNFSKFLIWFSLLAVALIFFYTNNLNQIRAEIYYVKALKSMESPGCQGVINNMEKALNLSPSNNYYQERYLVLFLNCFPSVSEITQPESRKDSLSRIIELVDDKEFYDNRINLARAYALLGSNLDKAYYEKAEKIYVGLIKDFPYFTTAYEDLGRQKMMQEDYQGVLDVYKRALEVLPSLDHPDLNDQHRTQISSIAVRLYEGLGQAYFKIKDYDLALDYYKEGLKLDPYRATLYKNIADIYYVQGQFDKAIAWNKRGLMLSPTDYNWPLALSLLYRDKKDLIKAKEYLDQALKLAPENQDLKNYYNELNK
ncbi:MAG: tetratricopeptide repeat protein [bacterium]|nr:tetratricopeptide repeat protein [bacterium]